MMKRDHGVVEDNGDAVIQKWFSENQKVKSHVHSDLLKNGKNCNLFVIELNYCYLERWMVQRFTSKTIKYVVISIKSTSICFN